MGTCFLTVATSSENAGTLSTDPDDHDGIIYATTTNGVPLVRVLILGPESDDNVSRLEALAADFSTR